MIVKIESESLTGALPDSSQDVSISRVLHGYKRSGSLDGADVYVGDVKLKSPTRDVNRVTSNLSLLLPNS